MNYLALDFVALLKGIVPRIVDKIGTPHNIAENGPHLGIYRTDDDTLTVCALEESIGTQSRVVVPATSDKLANVHVIHIAVKVNEPLEQRYVNVLSNAGTLLIEQGGDDTGIGVHSTEVVPKCGTVLHWRPIFFTCDIHHTAHGLCQQIVAWFLGVRAVLSKGRNRTVD